MYDEIRRRNWAERANANSRVDFDEEAAVIDKGLLMEVEAKYDEIEVCVHSLARFGYV